MMIVTLRTFSVVLVLAVVANVVLASPPDPAATQRAVKLAEVLRCLVCQNQSIADSNAPLARDLKGQIREQIEQGRSDEEILDFMVARYGDFVLYRPPVKSVTWALWVGPFLALFVGLGVLAMRLSRRSHARGDDLATNERDQAAQLLEVDAERLTP